MKILLGCLFASLVLISLSVHAGNATIHQLSEQLAVTPGSKQLLAQFKEALKTETNTDDKVHHAVIYCLGCFYTGQMAEGDALRQSILEKFPSSPDSELLASKNLTATCGKCNGTGKQDISCHRCNNSGQCTICKGAGQKQYQGFKNSSEIKNCPGCNGTGKCKGCNGTGQAKTSCLGCRGQGFAFSYEQVGKTYLSLLSPDAPVAVTPNQQSNGSSQLSMTDAEVIRKSENCQMTDMSIAETSNLLVRIHKITLSIGDNGTIKAGASEYAGFQIKTYEEWLSSKLTNLENAKRVAEQKRDLPTDVKVVAAGEISDTTPKLPINTGDNSLTSEQKQSPVAAIIMLISMLIGSITAFWLTSNKSASLRRWTALWILVPGYALFFGSIAYFKTVAGEIFVAIGCGMIMTGFILFVPDIFGFFARMYARIQEQKRIRAQQRAEALGEMTAFERETFLLREKEVAQQGKIAVDAKRERRGDRFAAAIVGSIALQKQSQAVEAQKAANRLQEEQNRLLREQLNKK